MGILYTNLKVLHFKEKVDSLSKRTGHIEPPINIRLKPTNICNHKCRYCAYGHGDNSTELFQKDEMEQRDFIPKDKMMSIIDDVIDMGVKAITFSGGGEPLSYKYMLDVLKKLSKSNVKFSTLTNGSLLRSEVAKLFAIHGTWVRVSMDGWDDKSYSDYRGVRDGEYTKIMNNMKEFKKHEGSCHLGVSLIIDKDNAPHVYDMIVRLKSIGVDSVKLSPCLMSDKLEDSNAHHKLIFNEVEKQVEKANCDLVDSSFEIFNSYVELTEKYEKDYTWCPFIQIRPVIGADLKVYACPDKAYNSEGMVGSLENQSFKEFWFSDKNSFFKINPSKHCKHHCETNQKNKLVLEYLDADKEHLDFL